MESLEDAVAAAGAGADRLELSSALALDGLTPSPGLLLETLRSVRVPIVAMARPREGNFCYSDAEYRVLRRDANFALEHGVSGIAFGILTDDGQIDTRRCRAVVRDIHCGGAEAVFHRGFDAAADLSEAMERLIDLGVRRVMTSGGKSTAVAGAPLLRDLVERAGARIEILPAGGIRSANAVRLLERTGCDQLHSSCRGKNGRMNGAEVKELVRRVRSAGTTR